MEKKMTTKNSKESNISRQTFLKFSATCAGGAILASCTPAATPTPETVTQPALAPTGAQLSEAAKILRVAVSENREAFDPAWYYGHTDSIIPLNSQEGLLRYKMGTYDFEPLLAESWEIKEGGKVIEFIIRQGVKYSDGTGLNAESIKFDIDRQMKIAQGPSWLLNDFLDQVSVDGEYQLTMTLKYALPGYLHHLANIWSTRFQSPTAYQANEKDGDMGQEWAATHTAGTGPYQLASFEQNSRAVMVRNEYYWKGWEGNHVEEIHIDVITEPSTLRLKLEEGDLDICLVGLTPPDYEALATNSNIQILKFPGGNQYNMGFVCDQPPMDDKRVRQALCYAFNYDDVINKLYAGHGVRSGPLLLDTEGDKPEYHTRYNFDLNKASTLLADAGYAEGFNLKGISRPVDPNLGRLFELYQSDLKKINIELEIEEVSGAVWTEYRKLEKPRDLLAFYWGPDTLDPGSSILPMYEMPGTHSMHYDNPQVVDLFKQAQLEADKTKRVATMEQIAEILIEDVPALYMFWPEDVWPMQKWVKNFQYNGFYTNTGTRVYDLYKEV
jgi:peptide/nickel transport system substrate-binding protein